MQNSGQVVLVVEDNEPNMRLFRDILEARGYRVIEATTGKDGWRSACEHHPGLIVMDIQLPDVNGLEVTQWLKADGNLNSIPVIAVTAFAMVGDEDKIRKSGCDAYISKPISVPKFLQTIEGFFAERGPNGAERDLGTNRSLK